MKKYESKYFLSSLKITLPWYFCVSGLMFAIFLPLIRFVATFDEIGPVMDANYAFFAIILFSNTYYMEIQQKTSEVFYLIPDNKKIYAMNIRILIKLLFLMGLFVLSYLTFNIHSPHLMIGDSYIILFLQAFFAVGSSILFWGILSETLVNVTHNLWVGVGISIVLWGIMNSTIGKMIPLFLNLFSYGDSNIPNLNWIISKIIGLLGAFILFIVNKYFFTQSPCNFKE